MRLTSITLAVLLLAAAGASARAEESCPLKAGAPIMSKADITKSLQDRGYTQIRSLATHDGCYEAKGVDKAGKRFELELNGQTGAIVNAE